MFANFTDTPPQVMGILNVTPDSFSDGGHYFSLNHALERARQMIAEGVDIIDIGGESTRPGATAISVQEELDRVMPVLEKVRAEWPTITLSVDTSQPQVMREAIAQGANLINDVRALQREGSLQVVAHSKTVGVCLMHLQGEPNTMQKNPYYQNVVREVADFLQMRIQTCLTAIAATRLCIDPGIGFGKTTVHNLLLIQQLSQLTQLGYPVLVGVSRKSLIGQVLNKPVTDRLYGGLALAVLAVHQGAKIIRTHDVAATVDALRITDAVLRVKEDHLDMQATR